MRITGAGIAVPGSLDEMEAAIRKSVKFIYWDYLDGHIHNHRRPAR
jgi:hypothetical protein